MIVSRISLIVYSVGALLVLSAVFQLANTLWLLPAAREEGREAERTASLKRSMELIEQRSRTNAEIRNLDDDGLCRAIGGVFENGECH